MKKILIILIIILIIISLLLKNNNKTVYTFYESIKPAINIDTNHVLVNKTYFLDKTYIPKNLIKINNKIYLNKEAYYYYLSMKNEMKKDNLNIIIFSGYRDYEYQKKLYNNYYSKDKENVDRYSAKAGHSEHQTGLAIDIYNGINDYNSFNNTKEYDWLINNSYKYGYILRYPKGKEEITGYMYEPWHFRYVGKILATKLYKDKITLEEYYK